MSEIKTFGEIDRLIFEPGTKITVYSSYILNNTSGFIYYAGIKPEVFESDLLKIYPITIWWEGDREKAYMGTMKLHIKSDMNLLYAMFRKSDMSDNIPLTYYDMSVLDTHHIILNFTHLFSTRKIFEYNGYSCAYTTHIVGKLFFNKKDALFETVRMFNYYGIDFFFKIKQFVKRILKKPKCRKDGTLGTMYMFDFVTSSDQQDIMRFRKVILMGYKVYQQSFKLFHDEYKKVSKRKNFTCLTSDEIGKMINLIDVNMFVRYLKMIYMYHFTYCTKEFKDSRDKYFKGYFNKVVNHKI